MLSSEKLSQLRRIRDAGRQQYLDYYIPTISPAYQRPKHLQPLIDLYSDIKKGKKIRAVVHAPPRHAKTETTLHAAPFILKDLPDWTIGFATYNNQLAQAKSAVAMNLAIAAGIELSKKNVTEWRTTHRGGFLPAGVGGTLTGFGLNLGLLDDLYKNLIEALSANRRQVVLDWFQSTFMTRLEPGAPVIASMTRWHEHDIASHCVEVLGWDYVCLPAINPLGQALWPERGWTVPELLSRKAEVGDYVWAALYQGQPQRIGGAVFNDPWGYAKLPDHLQIAIGLDLAYSEKTSSDYSVIVVMGKSKDGNYYILDVVRVQLDAPKFVELLRKYRKKYPVAPMRWYAAGTEKGVASFIRNMKDPSSPDKGFVNFEALPPKGDKFVRAQPYAAAWNAGRVLLPDMPEGEASDFPWLNTFAGEHATFTGVKDAHDDQVDAAVAAFDLLSGGASDWLPDDVKFPRRF